MQLKPAIIGLPGGDRRFLLRAAVRSGSANWLVRGPLPVEFGQLTRHTQPPGFGGLLVGGQGIVDNENTVSVRCRPSGPSTASGGIVPVGRATYPVGKDVEDRCDTSRD